MKKHYCDMVVSAFLGIGGLFIVIISSLKINSNLDNIWATIFVIGIFFCIAGSVRGYIKADYIENQK
ncbi:hypothetical protein DWB98_13375 (plasmid) [Staphylococcus xylosus]|uniref:hypothetical protein n=1 Tax=Staphylococcus xylosus TaxID=1288 RepID=UPI00118A8FD4|nr:hypothetical protein [Staphylococcus xylosus]QDW90433.1 hypothetical protein DWB98_13375 [Staphylococcus xylosus]